MKRYDHNCYSMDEKPDGDWVEHWEARDAITQRDCRIARLEHELKYALAVAALHGPAQDRVTQLEDEVAMLIHPHALAAYRAKKSLHK